MPLSSNIIAPACCCRGGEWQTASLPLSWTVGDLGLELKKEEASSLVCKPHRTYSCLTLRLSLYFIQLFNVPLERGTLKSWMKRSLHCGAVLLGTNVASTLPAVIAQWNCMGHQSCFNITSCHCMVEWYYGEPMLLLHCHPSLHSGMVLWGTNTASTSPAVIALWSCTMGHQLCFKVVHCHCMVEVYGAPTLL